MRRHSCWILLVVFAVTGCRSGPEGEPPLCCTLVLLKTGPRSEPLTQAEQTEVFGGHFDNMKRLAREGHLLVAGPYGKNDAALRGLFVLDTARPERAKELAETDPGFRAGVFAFEFHALETEAPLRAFLAAELEAQDEAERAGRKLQPGEGGRIYTLLTVEDGDAAAAALAGNPAVLLFARLDRKRAFVVLDAVDLEQARTVLAPVAERLGTHGLLCWYASGRLANLPNSLPNKKGA
ncbi:MAG TPA: YciI family protein [Planctomycetota bacterium]|nr:YciI family protein [Planctomycetota bacterium]